MIFAYRFPGFVILFTETGLINMIWNIFFVFLGLASARNVQNVEPEYLEHLRLTGQDEEFARLLGVDVSLVRANDSEQRSEGSVFHNVSPLGDILLSEEQERQGTNFQKWPDSKWKDGNIPYTIIRSDFNSDQIKKIEEAIADFNRKVRNVHLFPRRRQEDYIQIFSGDGCWSYFGRIGGQQPLSLQSDGCVTMRNIQHELIHALGFTHEHNRPDRDNFVRVLWDNIPWNIRSLYQKVSEEDYRILGYYDYYSVMHYPVKVIGSDRDAFEILQEGIDRNQVGRNEHGLTPWDAQKINELYA